MRSVKRILCMAIAPASRPVITETGLGSELARGRGLTKEASETAVTSVFGAARPAHEFSAKCDPGACRP